jgi:hypothetical protein
MALRVARGLFPLAHRRADALRGSWPGSDGLGKWRQWREGSGVGLVLE